MSRQGSADMSPKPTGSKGQQTAKTRGNGDKPNGNKDATTEAWKFMIEEGYVEKNQRLTGGLVATILRQGTAGATLKGALLPFKKFLTHLADMIEDGMINAIEERLNEAVETVQEATRALEAMKEKAEEAYEDTEKLVHAELSEDLRAFMERYTEENEELRKEMRGLTEEVQGLRENMGEATETTKTKENAPANPNTYAEALARELTKPVHREAIQREERKRKQIWVQLSKDAGNETFMTLGEQELTQKANETLKALKSDELRRPAGIRFVGAIKTRLNLVVLQLESVESAKWIEQPNVIKEFTSKFGLWAECNTTRSNIIVEFVPITADITNEATKREIETFNNLPQGSIVTAKWLKHPQNRSPTQTVGHAEIGLTSPEVANTILRDGITIRGRHVGGRKAIPTPIRCNNCQKYGHMARDCKTETKCARCAKEHKTYECQATDEERCCANCGDTGHGAASRDCWYLKERIKEMEKKRPELSYIYYPIRDQEWTWTRADGKMTTIEFRTEQARSSEENGITPQEQIRREQEHMMNLGRSWDDDTNGLDLERNFMNRRTHQETQRTQDNAKQWKQTRLPYYSASQNPPQPQNTPPPLPPNRPSPPPTSQRSETTDPEHE